MTYEEAYSKFCEAMNNVSLCKLDNIEVAETLQFYDFDSLDVVELVMEMEKILGNNTIPDEDVAELYHKPISHWVTYLQEHYKENLDVE